MEANLRDGSMFVKVFVMIILTLFCTNTAQADPAELLERNQKVHEVMDSLLILARTRLDQKLSGTNFSETAALQKELRYVLKKENDPWVIISIAKVALGYGGDDAGDEAVGDVFIFAVDACIHRLEELRTADALRALQVFQSTMRLDGGLSLTVEETLSRMKVK
jgi:hypothetical protein